MRRAEYDGNRLFRISFFLLFTWQLLSYSTVPFPARFYVSAAANLLAAAGFAVQIFFLQKMSCRRKLVLFLLVSLSACPVLVSVHNNKALLFVLAAAASAGTDLKKTVRSAFFFISAAVPVLAALSLTGIIPNYVWHRNGIYDRYALGFSHPNVLGILVFHWMCCLTYLFSERRPALCAAAGLLSVAFCYIVPNSQTAAAACAVLALFAMTRAFRTRLSWKLTAAEGIGMTVCAALFNIGSVFLSTRPLAKGSFIAAADRFLSSRFSNCYEVYRMCGGKASLLGYRIVLAEDMYLDNAYMSLLLRQGIIFYVIFSAGYLLAMVFLLCRRQPVLLFLFFLYALYAVMEPVLINPAYNVFALVLGKLSCDREDCTLTGYAGEQ